MDREALRAYIKHLIRNVAPRSGPGLKEKLAGLLGPGWPSATDEQIDAKLAELEAIMAWGRTRREEP